MSATLKLQGTGMAPSGFVKTSTTVTNSDSAIRTDLDSLITPPVAPQSGTSPVLQHRWQTQGCLLQLNDVVDEDEGDTSIGLAVVLRVSEFWPEASALTANLAQ